MATYRRTKHTRANGSVYYTYPNEASRRYYASKSKTTYKKPAAKPKPLTYAEKYALERAKDTKMSGEGEARQVKTSGGEKVYPKVNLGQMIKLARTKGLDFVKATYGEANFNAVKPKLEQIITNYTRNKKGGYKAQAGRFADGGAAPADRTPFKRQMNFNLSNDSDLAQGSEHEWAQGTSISALISGQLRQAANSPVDLFETWAQDKVGTLTVDNRSTPFGVDASFSFAQGNPMGAFGTNAVMEDYGAVQAEEAEDGDAQYVFGGWTDSGRLKSSDDLADWMSKDRASWEKAVSDSNDAYDKVFSEFEAKWDDANSTFDGKPVADHNSFVDSWYKKAEDAEKASFMTSYSSFYNNQYKDQDMMLYDAALGTTKFQSRTPSNNVPVGPTNLPMYENPGGTPTDGSIFGDKPQTYYNPWSRLEGGATNQYGPSQQNLAQGQMEAMALANAYFAPQRMELAYELGDMETDMRRLAVNLGRQVDDPVLQAKLYKEASRATRTLDIQQNTFAFQMAESRRSQDISNWQFYDQLAAQEAQLKLANRQFYDKLEIDKRMYNLNNWAAQQNASAQKTQPPASGTEESQSYGNLLSPYKTF